jgi:hypothetical protein
MATARKLAELDWEEFIIQFLFAELKEQVILQLKRPDTSKLGSVQCFISGSQGKQPFQYAQLYAWHWGKVVKRRACKGPGTVVTGFRG